MITLDSILGWVFSFYLLIITTIVISSCGGKRKGEDDMYLKSNAIPEEQLSHREAKKIFLQWVDIFSTESNISSGYDILTPFSKKYLIDKYSTHNVDQFVGWFKTLRASNTAPFYYSISRIDIQDINITDILATITASYQVRGHETISEEVGSFFLQKKNGHWCIPLCESSDLISSWWQRGMSMKSEKAEDGFISFRAESFGIELSYPQSWDITYPKISVLPFVHQSTECIEISYTPENEIHPQITFRIGRFAQPLDIITNKSDTTIISGLILKLEESADIPSEQISGTAYVFDDPQQVKTYIAYAFAPVEIHSFKSYQAIIQKIIYSIKLIRTS